MAFWGVEVKVGKPICHPPNNGRGRLHISQATLGMGGSMKNSVVQCNVGNKRPVFLCSLLPNKSESCQLHLEFDETDGITFSVIGPRSVHLTGYYVGSGQGRVVDDDKSESYGEDIRDTETEMSTDGDDDDYDDSFIDDSDEVYSSSSSDGEEETSEKRRHKIERNKRWCLRRKNQSIESESESECDDEQQQKCSDDAKTRRLQKHQVEKASNDVEQNPLLKLKSDVVINNQPKSHQENSNLQIDDANTKGDSGGFFFQDGLRWKNETQVESIGQSFPNATQVVDENADIEKKGDSKSKKKRKQETEENVSEVDKDNVIKVDKENTNSEKMENDDSDENFDSNANQFCDENISKKKKKSKKKVDRMQE